MPEIAVIHTVTWVAEEWRRMEALGHVRYHPGYPANEDELIARIGDAQIVVGADVEFTARVLDSSARLAMLALWSTGYNNVDLQAAQRKGVLVSHVPGYSAYSVAEHAWAMALHLAKRLGEADAHVRSQQFDWSAIEGQELHGKTVGILGAGHIGARSAAIARGFGCQVLACTRHPSPERAAALGVTFVELAELLARSDLIFVHVTLNPQTRHLLDRAAFAQMARRPILLNVARGPVVEMAALLDALDRGQIDGVGLDVLWEEPPDWGSPAMQRLLAARQVLLSPHCGSHTDAAFRRLTQVCLDNIEAYLRGKPANLVPLEGLWTASAFRNRP